MVRDALLDLWPAIRCRLRAILLAAGLVVAVAVVVEAVRLLT